MSRYNRFAAFFFLSILFWSNACTESSEPAYKNPQLPADERVEDLLKRMTPEEKIGQLSCLLGWDMMEKEGESVKVAEAFMEALKNRHVGMLWATLRADPWTRKSLENGLDPYLSALATNELQKYAIENSRLGIPLFFAEECVHGHMAIGTTVFPTAIGQASTWNPALICEMGTAIACEARLQGAHIGYGPVLDLAREPRWSRVEETYGEGPILIARMGEAMVRGFQGDAPNEKYGVVATLKHFVGYGNPEGGHNGGPANIGERDLLQNYLHPFECAVEAGALSVMSAYNAVDGIPCTANKKLFRDILQEKWRFNGFSVSDLGSIEGLASTHRVAADVAEAAALAFRSGIDVDLGGNAYSSFLKEAVESGKIEMKTLDEAAGRVLRLKFQMGLFENPYVDPKKSQERVHSQENVELAAQVARESVVLLKNESALLPLDKNVKRIAVIGPNADNIYNQLGDYTAPQPREKVVTVLDGIKNKLPADCVVDYVKGCAVRDASHDEIAQAVDAAKKADVAVVVLGGSSARDFKTKYIETGAAAVDEAPSESVSDMESGEGFDRSTLELMGKQEDLLKAVAATGTPVVLVLIQGRPLTINWADEYIPAILLAWYPGEQGGTAIADVLFGDYNPAGRLPISVPRSVGQLPAYYNHLRPERHDYVESSAKPLYAFGHGLSYSDFQYSGLEIKTVKEGVEIAFTIANAGNWDGDEVAQLYLTHETSSVATPVKQLKHFQRIHLKKGEQKQVVFLLKDADRAIYNADFKKVVESGAYTVLIGKSSDDIVLSETVYFQK